MKSMKEKQTTLFLKSMSLSPPKYGKRETRKGLHKETEKPFELFENVYGGKLTTIVDHINYNFEENEIAYVACCKEEATEKTGLDIASYLGFQNIVMYLLSLNSNPCIIDKKKRNTFHTVAFRGELDCAVIILNYLRYVEMRNLYNALYETKRAYKFKNLDIDHGELAKTVLHDEATKKRFTEFDVTVQKLLRDYCEKVHFTDSFIRSLKHTRRHYARGIFLGKTLSTTVLNLHIQDAMV